MVASELRIGEVRTTDQGRRAEVEFCLGAERYPVYFQSPNAALGASTEGLLACALLPAMRAAEALAIGGGDGPEVSRRLLSALPTIQDIFCDWEPSLRRVEVRGAVPAERAAPRGARTGMFFSGGVDSFYTLLKHRDEITDLVFVRGFDMSLESESLYQRTSSMIAEVGAFYGKRVVEVETNLRTLLDPHVDWACISHGAAMAAVGHLLSSSLARIYIPASQTYSRLYVGGSHPLLDPLWSSEALEFIHDGCEATRVDKVAVISGHEIVLRSLRVCFTNTDGAYNCGRCEKCVRTMLALRAFGALERCTTFDAPLEVRNILSIDPAPVRVRLAAMDNLRALEKRGGEEEYCRALRSVLARPLWPGELKKRIRAAAMRHPVSSRIYGLLKRIRRALRGLAGSAR